MKHVAVFGMGYVGCVTGACISRDGHRVIGVDVDHEKVALVNAARSPVSEPGLQELLVQQVKTRSLRATTDIGAAVRGSDMALVAVGTPSSPDGSVESTAVERVVECIGRELRGTDRPYTVVIRSTLLPGVLEDRLAPLLEKAADCELGNGIHLCNNPEFLRETTAIRDYDNPPYVLVGTQNRAAAETVLDLYGRIDSEHIVTDTRTAAMVKYTCNAFHALKIDFANEIGTLAKALGADGQEVMRIACRDTHLNISPAYLRPGFAFGGSCLPKDVRALVRFAQQRAIHAEVLSALLPSNESHLNRAFRAIQRTGCRRIGLVGLSFKAGTDDLRESPLVILAETLLGRGFDLKVYDPGVRVPGLVGSNLNYVDERLPHLAALLVDEPAELYEHAELLVLGTDIADRIDWQDGFAGETIDLRRDLVVAGDKLLVDSGRSQRLVESKRKRLSNTSCEVNDISTVHATLLSHRRNTD